MFGPRCRNHFFYSPSLPHPPRRSGPCGDPLAICWRSGWRPRWLLPGSAAFSPEGRLGCRRRTIFPAAATTWPWRCRSRSSWCMALCCRSSIPRWGSTKPSTAFAMSRCWNSVPAKSGPTGWEPFSSSCRSGSWLAALAVDERGRAFSLLAASIVAAGAAILSVAIEFTQLWFPPRHGLPKRHPRIYRRLAAGRARLAGRWPTSHPLGSHL